MKGYPARNMQDESKVIQLGTCKMNQLMNNLLKHFEKELIK